VRRVGILARERLFRIRWLIPQHQIRESLQRFQVRRAGFRQTPGQPDSIYSASSVNMVVVR